MWYWNVFMWRLLLNQRKLQLNANCCIKVVILFMHYLTNEPHARVVYYELLYQMVHFYVIPLSEGSLHFTTCLWTWHMFGVRKVDYLGAPGWWVTDANLQVIGFNLFIDSCSYNFQKMLWVSAIMYLSWKTNFPFEIIDLFWSRFLITAM